jgi:peptidylprolyl isomerase
MNHKRIKSLLLATTIFFSCGVMAQQLVEEQNATTNVVQSFDVNKISETFGHLIGENLDTPGFQFDLESIIKGMRDATEGKPSPMTQEEYEEAITSIQEQAFSSLSDSNLSQADIFLENNRSETNIVEVEPGKLQYRIIAEGGGDEVFEHSAPLIHYTGTFIDGTVFGSSIESGEPITLPLTQTIPGFNKGIVGMKEGEKRTLYVHPELGYGTTGHLPPNSLLIFEIEVVKANNNALEEDVAVEANDLDEDEADLS